MKAAAIKKLRLGMGFTQREFANLLCSSRAMVTRLESGVRTASRATLMLLTRVMVNREAIMVHRDKWAKKPKAFAPMDIIMLRECKRLTQEEFGKLLGVSWNYVCLLENGKRRISNKLCRLLELLAA